MESIAKSDIFFTVSTVAFAILALLLAIIFLYVIKILRRVYDISKIVQKKAAELSHTLGDVEGYIKDSQPVHFITSLLTRKKKPKAKVKNN